jgi:hypothetical protein
MLFYQINIYLFVTLTAENNKKTIKLTNDSFIKIIVFL